MACTVAHKAELFTWNEAVLSFEEGKLEGALSLFTEISHRSRILYNIGVIHLNMGPNYEKAISAFSSAVSVDDYFSLGFFQLGVCYYYLKEYSQALCYFQDSFAVRMRGNILIDYKQLGLDFRLWAVEIQFNIGVVLAKLGQLESAITEWIDASASAKQSKQIHIAALDEVIKNHGNSSEIFQVPLDCIYKPPPEKMANAQKIQLMGEPMIIASMESTDNLVGFEEPQLRKIIAENHSKSATPIKEKYESFLPSLSKIKSSVAVDDDPKLSNALISQSLPKKSLTWNNNSNKHLNTSHFRHSNSFHQPKPPSSILSGSNDGNVYNITTATRQHSFSGSENEKLNVSLSTSLVKIKIHYEEITRLMMLEVPLNINDFSKRIFQKLNIEEFQAKNLFIKFKDDEDDFILITDQDDLNMVLEQNNIENTAKKIDMVSSILPKKIEVWVSNL